MLRGVFFHRLERIAREIRLDNRPFGGIQLILSGDFLQLPPVPGTGGTRGRGRGRWREGEGKGEGGIRERKGKEIRLDHRPFGGIQLLLSGDFL
jgi:hypothetical protein